MAVTTVWQESNTENEPKKLVTITVYTQTIHQPTFYGSPMYGITNLGGKPNSPKNHTTVLNEP